MSALSKDDYLKRYMSKEKGTKRKKIRKGEGKTSSLPRSRIVDDDIDVNALLPENLSNTLEDDVGDNDPTVVEFVDERPEHVRRMELYQDDDRWKVLNDTKDSQTAKRAASRSSDSDSDQSDSDSDPSPVRRRRHDSDSENSPIKRRRHDSDGDNSPATEMKQHSDSDNSPLRTARHDCDNSPARNVRKDRDNSGQGKRYLSGNDNRKRRADIEQHSDNDISPPRRKQKSMTDVRDRDYKDQKVNTKQAQRFETVNISSQDKKSSRDKEYSERSPPKRQHKSRLFQSASFQKDSDSDRSPPRRQKGRPESDQSKPRKLDDDLSPPRRQRPAAGIDQSQARKQTRGEYSDRSPPRKARQGGDYDHSPPRRKMPQQDFDQSPPRGKRPGPQYDQSDQRRKWPEENYDQSPPRRQHSDRDKSKKPQKTLSGATAGLSSAREMKAEADKLRKKETEAFNEIDDESLGRNARTVFRDKSGRRRNLEEEKREQSEEDARKAAEAEKYKEWGQGLKQKQLREEAVTDLLHEVDKPLARYKDDADLDRMMRSQDREGDPMLQFMSRKKKGKEAKGTEKPRYKGPAPPPNRYNIQPGYRWDGVDRSNGFEKQLFAKMADRKATSNIAHKWSVEEM